MQFLLTLLLASGVVCAEELKVAVESFESKIWIINPGLQLELENLKKVENVSYRSKVLASHRTALATKLSLALQEQGCLPVPSVTVLTTPFGFPGEAGDEYMIKSEKCRVMKKIEGVCESGFNARNLNEPGLESYKICLKEVTPAVVDQKNGEAVP